MIVVAALALLVLGGSAVGGPWWWVQRSSADHISTAAEAQSAPVALVLGAGLTAPLQPSPLLAARLDVAAELYRAGKVKVVLVSGDNREADHNEPDAMRAYLLARGLPADHVVADYAGIDTYDSCVRARRIFGVERLLVISQGYHLPRAVAVCRAAGLDADGVGDWTAQQRFPDVWRSGEQRELLANIKAVTDVLNSRDPILGEPETGVTDALRRTP